MKTKRYLPNRVLFSCLAALFLALPGRAADPYSGNLWDRVDLKQVLAAAADITVAKYPDCDEATVESKMVRVYRADGTGEAQDETFIKLLTEKGKRNNRTLSQSFMLPYFTVQVTQLDIIKPNGEVVPVDIAANSKETVDDSQMSMNIYDPNSKVLRVNIPKVEIGDVVHSIVRTTTHRSIIPGTFAEYNLFEGSGFIRHILYEVHSPQDRPLQRIVLRDEVPGTVKYSKQSGPDSGTIHRWEVNQVPRMFDEPAMPPYGMVLQRLLVSTVPDWQTISKWYWDLSQSHLDATSPDMQKSVDDLTASSASDLDRLKAVFYFVSKKIRYMGLTPEKDRPGFEPHDVKLTFEKKYGVCRDKAALLVSLLRMAKLNAFPVLINVGLKKDRDVPEPFFNHAIVAVELKKGDYTLMDPTDENTRDLLPSSECDQSFLVCRPEGETIQVSPIKPPEDNMMRVQTAATLSASGTLLAKSQLWFDGINDNTYRDAFARMKPDDQRRFFERNLKRAMPGATLKSLKLLPENMLDISTGVHAELEFTAQGMVAYGNKKAVVNVPWIGNGLGVANFILGGAGLEKRKYPLQTYVACGLKEEIDLRLAEGFGETLSLPSGNPIDDRGMSYQQRFQSQGRSVQCARQLKLNVVEFAPHEYARLKQTLEVMEYDERKGIVLSADENLAALAVNPEPAAPVPVDSNARVLQSSKQLEILDAHSSVYRIKYAKRILSYQGKVREAEVKLDYNPSCQEAKLLKAVVVSPSGQRQEISKDEINIMDAGWNASAKRYTGGKILVANLPGVDIGSTIEVEVELRAKGKAFISGFESFQLPDELDSKTFQLTCPADLPIYKLVRNAEGCIQEKEIASTAGKQSFAWHSEKVKALPDESQLPPDWVYLPGVCFFAGNPIDYVETLHETLLDRAQKCDKARSTTSQLTHDAKDRLDALRAIRDFVAKSIRQAGPSFTELPLSELSAADTTLTEGYGHGADRAILLFAMLKSAGLQPEFVLASGWPPIPAITNVTASFPFPQAFQIVLVRTPVDGVLYYLNDSDQYAKLGSTAFDGKLAFVPTRQAYDVIHAAKDCQDKTDTVYTLSVADSGKTRLGIVRQYYGGNFNAKNRFFSELPPEERRRYFQEVVSHVAQGARPLGELVTRFDTYPGTETFSVEIDRYSVVDGNYLYFDLPFTPSLFPAGADRRTLPLMLARETAHTVRTEIDLPPSFRQLVMVPPTETLSAPAGGGKADIQASQTGSRCVITHTFETSPTIIPPQDYSAMLKVESSLGRKSSRVFLLEKK